MRTPTRSVAVSLLPPSVLAAAFVIALAFTFASAVPARAASDDGKDWKVMGEMKIKDAKEAAGGGGKDRKRGDKDKDKGKDKKDKDKKDGEKKDGEKAEAGTAAGEIDVVPALVKRIKFEVRGAEVEFKKITVTYESGDPEEIEVREEKVRNRGRTRDINLKGGNRAIKKVLVSYKAEKTDNAKESDRDALIVLLGHK